MRADGIDLEAEYNNRRRVPDFPAYVERWAREAAAFRAEAKGEIGLAYGPSERSVYDLFRPESAEEAGLAVFVHGGYWQALDRSRFSHMAAGLVARGYAVAVPSYDLCPRVSLAEIVEAMRRFCLTLWARHRRRLILTGHSAGGHLAAMMLATDWPALDPSAPPDLVEAIVPISGLFDLTPLIRTSINDALRLDAETAERLSPIRLAPRAAAPIFAAVGADESDAFRRQSAAYAKAWHGRCHEVTGAHHFSVIEPLCDPASALIDQIIKQTGGRP